MRTLTTTVAPSKRESPAAFAVQTASRDELMQAVLRISAAAGPVRGFRPHVVNTGSAQIEVTGAPAFRTSH